MKTDKTAAAVMRSAACGAITMLMISLLLTAVCSALVYSGMLAPAWMKGIAFGITAVSALFGVLLCGKQLPRWKLPGCLLSVMIYLLCIYILRCSLFGSDSVRKWGVIMIAAAAGLIGALFSGAIKRR